MTLRTILFLLLAGLAAAATMQLARGWLSAERAAMLAEARTLPQAPAPVAAATRVLVAGADLPAGTILQPKHLGWQAWPDESLLDAYLVEGERLPEDLGGAVVRTGIAAGQPVTEGLVVRPGERGFLAAVLRPGMRAVSVPVNATTGIAGFVFPGDRVDLILTHAVGASGEGRRHASETVLAGIRVIAVDQKTDDQNGAVEVAKTATLEVTPKQAEKVAMLTDLGRLSLSLRSLARADAAAEPEPAPRTVTLDSEVSRLLAPPAGAGRTHSVTVMRAGEAQELRFPAGDGR